MEEPQLDRVATYFDTFEINYGDIIKFGENTMKNANLIL